MSSETEKMESEGTHSERKSQEVEQILSRYKDALQRSSLPDVDKRKFIELLESKPASQHNAEFLKGNIDFLPHVEAKAEEHRKEYEKRIDEAVRQDLFSKNPQSKKEYMEWLMNQPFDEREKILSQPLHKMEDRKRAAEMWKRIPEAERKLHQNEWDNLGVEERLEKAEKLKIRHEELKAAFLKLPKEIQEKNRDALKAGNFRERERLLQSLGSKMQSKSPEKSKSVSESAESQKLNAAFDSKMQHLISENLFSPLSMPAYQHWFAGLSIEQKRKNLQKSDLDNPERVTVRDKFAGLPIEKRKSLEFRFRNADLDGRKGILTALEHRQKPQFEGKNEHYPESVLKHTLSRTLEDPGLSHQRVLFTMANRVKTLRRRAEIRYDAKKTEDLSRKAEERGNAVDTTGVFHLEGLEHHADQRFFLKRWLIRKEAKGNDAIANNMTLLDKKRECVTSEQFNELIVNHLKDELLAGLIARAAPKLPNVNRAELAHVAENMNLELDLKKTAV